VPWGNAMGVRVACPQDSAPPSAIAIDPRIYLYSFTTQIIKYSKEIQRDSRDAADRLPN